MLAGGEGAWDCEHSHVSEQASREREAERIEGNDLLSKVPCADDTRASDAQHASRDAPRPKPDAQRARDRPICPPAQMPFVHRASIQVPDVAYEQQAEGERDERDGHEQRREKDGGRQSEQERVEN